MTDLTLKRLMPEDPLSWGYWPIFEARVRALGAELEPDANLDNMIQSYRTLWATRSAQLGAWLILRPVERTNGHTPLPQVLGHLAGYQDTYWGTPCLMIHQFGVAKWEGAFGLLTAILYAWDGWRAALNERYVQTMQPLMSDLVRFYAMQPEAAIRWFREMVELRRGGTLLSFRLSEVAVPSEG